MSTPHGKPHDPVTVIQASAAKEAEKADRRATMNAFRAFLFLLAILHCVGTLIFVGEGLQGYIQHWVSLVRMLLAYPWTGALIFFNLIALHHGIHLWRHRFDDKERIAPPYPEVPDLRFCDDIYIGSAYTFDGKQPGDILKPGDVILDPHVILSEKGLFGNLHVKGGIGSGKTSTFIYPVIDQSIMKYPRPHPPERFPLGRDGRFKATPPSPGDPFHRDYWNPYVGLTEEQAAQKYQELLDQHLKNKWGLLVFDPKGDITQFVMQSAKAAGREHDVIVLRPDGEWTYNPLGASRKGLITAERFMDGIEAVTGSTMHAHYRQTGSEFMANMIDIIRAVSPANVNFKTLLTLTRKEEIRSQWVNQARTKARELQEEEERCRRLGRRYTGPRVNPAAIEFFDNWDDVESDPTQKRAVTSGIKAQAKFFVDDEMSPWLCPDMPATFRGFPEMIDKGHIVVFQMPVGDYASVGRVLGILLLMDAQSAAMQRLDPDNPINKNRVVGFVIDEVANYLNSETKKFISMNRQAKVFCLFAHQSQGQLAMEGDRSFEVSFNDNLRSKISYSAPNNISAEKESHLFGRRNVIKERYSESSTMRGAVREDGGDTVRASGGEMKGATVSMEEVERAWFSAEDFLSLETGHCVVSEFDGNTTRSPRRIVAPALWDTERGRRIMHIPVVPPNRRPHPVLYVSESEADIHYLDTGLSLTGYIVVETLLGKDGSLQGIKFVSEAGTLIVPVELLRSAPEVYDKISTRLSDSHAVILLTDGVRAARVLRSECNVRFERVLQLPESLLLTSEAIPDPLLGRVSGAEAVRDFRSLFSQVTGTALPYLESGGWEYHIVRDHERTKEIEEVSRLMLQMYIAIGAVLHDAGEDIVDDLCDETLRSITEQIEAAQEAERADTRVVAPEQTVVAPAKPKSGRGTEGSDVIAGPKEKKPKAKTSPKPRRKKPSEPGSPPLFDLNDLNDVLAPSPFGDSPDRAAETSPDPTDPGDGGGDGGHDIGPGRESADGPTNSFDPDLLLGDSFGEDDSDDSSWPTEDDFPSDDDPFYPG